MCCYSECICTPGKLENIYLATVGLKPTTFGIENVIPRIFPTYSPNPKGSNFSLYCKYQLLRYKPWKTTQNNAWGDQESN